jgi:hypothetical protein
MIVDDLLPLAKPIESLWLWEGNYRQGDVGAVSVSLERFGQTKPIVARHFKHGRKKPQLTVIAGNHTLKAALLLGWDHLAVVTRDDLTEEEAVAYAIADNRTNDLATNNESILVELLLGMADDQELLIATGYDNEDVAQMQNFVENGFPGDTEKLDDLLGDSSGDRDEVTHGPDRGEGLLAVNVTVAEPSMMPETGSVWQLGPHVLLVANVMKDWGQWTPYLLTKEHLFVPYPGPHVPVAQREHPMVMVQPERYVAGHMLDAWRDATGEEAKELM